MSSCDRERGERFTASGLAHDAQRLVAFELKGDPHTAYRVPCAMGIAEHGTVGMMKFFQPAEPEGGSQLSWTEKLTIGAGPNRSPGIACPVTERSSTARSMKALGALRPPPRTTVRRARIVSSQYVWAPLA